MVDFPAVGLKGQGSVLDEFLKVSFNSDGTLKTAGGSAQLTNKSGGSVAGGDLVWMDYASDNSFTTSTTQDKNDGIPGIAQGAIADNASGTVAIGDHIIDINFSGTPTLGQYVRQSSSAKLCEGVTTISAGCFAKVARTTTQYDIIYLSYQEYMDAFLVTKYITIPACAFDWLSGSDFRTMSGAASINLDVGSSSLMAQVSLPNGCTVTEIACSYYDGTNVSTHTIKLVRHTLSDYTETDMASVALSLNGSAGHETAIDNSISNAIIDNSLYSYYCRLSNSGSVSANNKLKAVRIAYTQAAFGDLM